MDDSEASLPKSTLVKLVREALPPDVRVASETQDLLVKCSTEFVQLLGTQANEVTRVHLAAPYSPALCCSRSSFGLSQLSDMQMIISTPQA